MNDLPKKDVSASYVMRSETAARGNPTGRRLFHFTRAMNTKICNGLELISAARFSARRQQNVLALDPSGHSWPMSSPVDCFTYWHHAYFDKNYVLEEKSWGNVLSMTFLILCWHLAKNICSWHLMATVILSNQITLGVHFCHFTLFGLYKLINNINF